MKTERSSRRDFLKASLPGAAFLCAGGAAAALAAAEPLPAATKSSVVVARDEKLRGAGSAVDSKRMLALLDRAMQALFDRDHPVDAWSRLVRPGETVGLKVNTLGGRGISTNVQLVAAVCERLQEAGVKPGGIVVWDRDSGELERAGFHLAIGRRPRAMLWHRPRRLRSRSFRLGQRGQPLVEDSHPATRTCSSICPC